MVGTLAGIVTPSPPRQLWGVGGLDDLHLPLKRVAVGFLGGLRGVAIAAPSPSIGISGGVPGRALSLAIITRAGAGGVQGRVLGGVDLLGFHLSHDVPHVLGKAVIVLAIGHASGSRRAAVHVILTGAAVSLIKGFILGNNCAAGRGVRLMNGATRGGERVLHPGEERHGEISSRGWIWPLYAALWGSTGRLPDTALN